MKKLRNEVLNELQTVGASLPAVSMEELAKHNKKGDAWILIDGIVYDVSKFVALHPGGERVILQYAGTDASKDFRQVHSDSVLKRAAYQKLRVGRLDYESLDPAMAKVQLQTRIRDKWLPFSQTAWFDPRGTFVSPHWDEKHRAFRDRIRDYYMSILPVARQVEETGKLPLELYENVYKDNMWALEAPKEEGGTPPPEGWDCFFVMIMCIEQGRILPGGFSSGFFGARNISLQPLRAHGSSFLKTKYVRAITQAELRLSLAVTEPWGGSDVASVRTTAVDCGDHYLVNGEKKFITGGLVADLFTTAVRTDPKNKGMKGLSLLLIDAKLPGVERRGIKTQGWWGSQSAYITFDNVKVPKDHLIGKEGEGFVYIMENFNSERFAMICQCIGGCQACIEDSVKFARARVTFGKPLIENQAIRLKIANMAMKTEALAAWAESIAFMLNRKVPLQDLAPRIALCKVLSSQTLEYCTREASQILGGYSYTRGSGPGEQVEQLSRLVRVMAIGGGSEEVMLDFGVRASKI